MSYLLYLKKGQEDPTPFKLYEYEEPDGGRLHVPTTLQKLELASLKVHQPGTDLYVPVAFHTQTGLSLDKFKANTQQAPLSVAGKAAAPAPVRPAAKQLSSLHWPAHSNFMTKRITRLDLQADAADGSLAGLLQPSIGLPTEGIYGQPWKVDRTTLCSSICEALKKGLVWIKAPPQSGKTAMLQLLGEFIKSSGAEVSFHYVNCSLLTKNFDAQYPQKLRGRPLEDLIESGESHVVAFDEVQSIYDGLKSKSSAFWAIIKDLLQGGKKVFVVLAASYGTTSRAIGSSDGSPTGSEGGSSAASADAHTITPGPAPLVLHAIEAEQLMTVQLPNQQMVGHTLALTEEEWGEMQDTFKRSTRFELLPAVLDHIYHLCGGQVGLLVVCLRYIQDHVVNGYRESSKRSSKKAMWELTSKQFLNHLSSVRSLVNYGRATRTVGSKQLLNRLMWRQQVEEEEAPALMPAARALQWCGIVVISHTNRVTFTSPLHRLWYTHQHYTHRATPESSLTEDPRCLAEQLLLGQLQLISPWLLEHTATRSKADGPPLEAFWEAEIYRVGVESTVSGTVVSVQAGKADGAHGLVDVIYGEPYKVALELLVNGKGISEHLRRFELNGRYHPLIDSGIVEDWLVVDFRMEPGAQQARLEHERLYTVIVSADFHTLTVMNEGRQCGEAIQLSQDRTQDALAALQSVQAMEIS